MGKYLLAAVLAIGLLAGCSDKAPSAPDKIDPPPAAASQALRPPQAK